MISKKIDSKFLHPQSSSLASRLTVVCLNYLFYVEKYFLPWSHIISCTNTFFFNHKIQCLIQLYLRWNVCTCILMIVWWKHYNILMCVQEPTKSSLLAQLSPEPNKYFSHKKCENNNNMCFPEKLLNLIMLFLNCIFLKKIPHYIFGILCDLDL